MVIVAVDTERILTTSQIWTVTGIGWAEDVDSIPQQRRLLVFFRQRIIVRSVLFIPFTEHLILFYTDYESKGVWVLANERNICEVRVTNSEVVLTRSILKTEILFILHDVFLHFTVNGDRNIILAILIIVLSVQIGEAKI